MTMLSDAALARLRTAADMPDLSATRYRLLDKLGQGGMGSVYRVEDSILRRQVARPRYPPADRTMLAAPAKLPPAIAGRSSWSRRRPWCAGTAS